jgi:hypothetical protein
MYQLHRSRASADRPRSFESSDRASHLNVLARQAARWTTDNAERIGDADPDMPQGIFNREADNWRPLLAIADAAGDDWPERARDALQAAHTAKDDESRLVMLLADVKGAFEEMKADRLASSSLIAILVELEGRPWAEYRKGKPMTQNQLARALKPIGIAPEVIRSGDSTPRGYTIAQFAEAFERYLAPEGSFKPQQRNKRDECSTSDMFQTATRKTDVTVQKSEKPNNDGLCCGVAVQNPPEAGNGRHGPVCDHCGERGDLYPIAYGDIEAVVHPYCRDVWIAAHQDDLTIPPYLDRRPGRGREPPDTQARSKSESGRGSL